MDRIEEAVAEPHADRAVAPVRVDAAIDRASADVCSSLLVLAAAEEVEQAAAAALRRSRLGRRSRCGPAHPAAPPPPPVAAAAGERLALLLELGELTARVLDAVVHLEAFRAAHQASAEDEEALEAVGILHRRLGALEHAVGLGDLLVDARHVVAIGAAAACAEASSCWSCMQRISLVAQSLRQGQPGAADERRAAQREQGKRRSTLGLTDDATTRQKSR